MSTRRPPSLRITKPRLVNISSSFPRSPHEDRLREHSGEDGVQREVREPSVFQLQATGQPGTADDQTQQRGRLLFQQLIPTGSESDKHVI